MPTNKIKIVAQIILITAFTVFLVFMLNSRHNKNIVIEGPTGIIFGKNNIFFFVPGKEGEEDIRWTPTKEDVRKAEKILAECAKKEQPDVHKKLDQYKRQYVGIVRGKSKQIYINAFIDKNDHFEEWKEFEVLIHDGGDSFFSVDIDLEKSACYMFFVHKNG